MATGWLLISIATGGLGVLEIAQGIMGLIR